MQKDGMVSVIVYTPNKENGYFGHVAIRTYRGGPDNQGYYMSFWPDAPEDTTAVKFSLGSFHGILRDSAYDLAHNPGATPLYFDFYALDDRTINHAFEIIAGKIKLGNYTWTVFGLDIFTLDTHNCCTFVLSLLLFGGIAKMVTQDVSSMAALNLSIGMRLHRVIDGLATILNNISKHFNDHLECDDGLRAAAGKMGQDVFQELNHEVCHSREMSEALERPANGIISMGSKFLLLGGCLALSWTPLVVALPAVVAGCSLYGEAQRRGINHNSVKMAVKKKLQDTVEVISHSVVLPIVGSMAVEVAIKASNIEISIKKSVQLMESEKTAPTTPGIIEKICRIALQFEQTNTAEQHSGHFSNSP